MSYDDHISYSLSVRAIKVRYYAITFLLWFATALPLALSVLLAQARGLSLAQVGFALGAYSLCVVLLEVPTGGLADAVGRRRVALLAFALAALYSLAFLFAFSFPALLAAMLLYGVSRALSSGALDAWFVDALQAADPALDLQPALAGAETVSLLALGAGTLVGGALPALFPGLPADGTAVLTPLAVPVVASLAVKLALLAAVALFVPNDRPAGGASWRAGFRAVPALVRSAVALSRSNGRLGLLMLASFVAGFAVISLEAFWQPYFAALPGMATADGQPRALLLGVIMAGNFLVGAGGNLLSSPLTRRLGGRRALVAGLARLAQGASILALAASAALVPAAGFFWLTYLLAAVGISPHATLVNEEIPAERRSAMLSVQSLAAYLGSFIGGSALGYVADHLSISLAWAIAAALTAASVVPYLLLERRRVNPDRPAYRDLSEANW